MLRAAIVLLFLLLLPSRVCAEARIALLIGNQVYTPKVGVLRNPHEDVALVGAALKELGFQVTILKDAGYRDLDVAIKRFIADVRSKGRGAISFFYYSGHGAANPDTQINYLIPVDVADPNDGNLWYQSFQQNELIDRLSKQAPNATHYVVFDACRNELNLSGTAAKAISAEKGFVPVPQTPGLLIAYATAQGKTASDIGDAGGPYAKALAAEMLKPGIEAVTMFRNVQIRVKEDIGQDPWLSFPALPPVYLAGRTTEPATAPDQPASAAEVVRVCREVEAMTSLSMLAVLERQHAGTPAADCISARMGELRAKATANKAAEEAERKRAAAEVERQRLALLDKQEEARKAAEEEAQRICVNVGGILNLEVLGALANRHKGSSAAVCIADRIALLRKQEVTAPSGPTKCRFVEARVGKEQRCLKPKDSFRDCPTCPEMVVVPAGSFTMGSPTNEPQRSGYETQVRVSILAAFAVGKFAVTFDEWDECVADGGCYKPADQGWGRGKLPVINVTWDDTKSYAAWMSRKTGNTYRLLSETEREYVTRADTTTPFWWGSSISPTQANFDGNYTYGGGEKGEYRQRTVPVGSFEPNPWGLYNVHGNVWEWTEDCWNDSNNDNPVNGAARTTGECTRRVVRGGSWNYNPRALRSAYRDWFTKVIRNNLIGFRLARTLSP